MQARNTTPAGGSGTGDVGSLATAAGHGGTAGRVHRTGGDQGGAGRNAGG